MVVCIIRSLIPQQRKEAESKGNIVVEQDLSHAAAWELPERAFAEADEVVFINNASTILPLGDVGSLDDDDLAPAFALSLVGACRLANHVVGQAHRHRVPLRIINITSGAALHPIPGLAVYCASKAGMRLFFDTIQEEGSAEVIHFDPGVMDTEMQAEARSSGNPSSGLFRDYLKDGKLQTATQVARRLLREHGL